MRIEKVRLLSDLLKQPNGKPQAFEKEVLAIYAGISGFIDSVNVEDMNLFEEKLITYVERHADEIFKTIKRERAVSDATEEKIKEMFTAFKETHRELFLN